MSTTKLELGWHQKYKETAQEMHDLRAQLDKVNLENYKLKRALEIYQMARERVLEVVK